ncbi:MAG: hypothetical protein ACR2PX_07150 [Endozoicomonas sp.]|uniref:hypothetical protein n=1 Tax=Endozoicomonas sp. TaxID=1892382 RepID=UPI003D9B1F98
MNKLKTAEIGIDTGQQEQVSRKLLAVYCEREALMNCIRATQWNTQDSRSAEFNQMLSAFTPESQYQQQRPTQSSCNPNIQSFAPSNQIAERISINGYCVPADYVDLKEHSKINAAMKGTTVQENTTQLSAACEQFTRTTREAIETARQAKDAASIQALTDQLRPAEQLATQLKRFQ